MLAREIKIANLKKQKEFIIKQLSTISKTNKNGDISYLYTGYLFPEVRYYFENDGFKIEDFFDEGNGFPIGHLFTIRDNLKLTESERKEAENFDYTAENNYSKSDEAIDDSYEDEP